MLGGATICLLVIYVALSRVLSPLALGNEAATGLGVNHFWVSNTQLITAVLAAALATAVVGPLGFVGLLSPHLTRAFIKTGPAFFLVLTAFVGGLLVLVADLIGRTLFAPIQLPAGLMTSILGAPIFIALMMKGSANG
jgi:iron complex transport system permease protein